MTINAEETFGDLNIPKFPQNILCPVWGPPKKSQNLSSSLSNFPNQHLNHYSTFITSSQVSAIFLTFSFFLCKFLPPVKIATQFPKKFPWCQPLSDIFISQERKITRIIQFTPRIPRILTVHSFPPTPFSLLVLEVLIWSNKSFHKVSTYFSPLIPVGKESQQEDSTPAESFPWRQKWLPYSMGAVRESFSSDLRYTKPVSLLETISYSREPVPLEWQEERNSGFLNKQEGDSFFYFSLLYSYLNSQEDWRSRVFTGLLYGERGSLKERNGEKQMSSENTDMTRGEDNLLVRKNDAELWDIYLAVREPKVPLSSISEVGVLQIKYLLNLNLQLENNSIFNLEYKKKNDNEKVCLFTIDVFWKFLMSLRMTISTTSYTIIPQNCLTLPSKIANQDNLEPWVSPVFSLSPSSSFSGLISCSLVPTSPSRATVRAAKLFIQGRQTDYLYSGLPKKKKYDPPFSHFSLGKKVSSQKDSVLSGGRISCLMLRKLFEFFFLMNLERDELRKPFHLYDFNGVGNIMIQIIIVLESTMGVPLKINLRIKISEGCFWVGESKFCGYLMLCYSVFLVTMNFLHFYVTKASGWNILVSSCTLYHIHSCSIWHSCLPAILSPPLLKCNKLLRILNFFKIDIHVKSVEINNMRFNIQKYLFFYMLNIMRYLQLAFTALSSSQSHSTGPCFSHLDQNLQLSNHLLKSRYLPVCEFVCVDFLCYFLFVSQVSSCPGKSRSSSYSYFYSCFFLSLFLSLPVSGIKSLVFATNFNRNQINTRIQF
ncbi:hypothetical protein VP01_391g3 [Puccinia sorghi]|uniref:Uncharacterized protein n=1 Tax=Puccinia sorghi TaxID=27349 RepID=A0A0L6UUI0_9BASI|nr:hypothetical protein VP01_391g3 [Puccinia sorghi]